MTVAVVVPWRGGDPDRERAWAWLSDWWARQRPDWPVVVGEAPDGPWCKAAAVADALTRTDADLLVIADADVYPVAGIDAAVDAVTSGRVAWAMPHLRVYRLTAAGTDRLMTTGQLPPPVRVAPPRGTTPTGERLVAEAHRGVIGGGCVVLPRALYEQAPMDPRFLGFGGEDQAWGHCLRLAAGPPFRVTDPLWHFWHQPQPRISRAVGSLENLALYRRYRAATTQEQMLTLLSEFRHSHAQP